MRIVCLHIFYFFLRGREKTKRDRHLPSHMPAMAGDGLGAKASSSEGGPQSLSWMTRISLFIYTAYTHVYTGRKLELGARN